MNILEFIKLVYGAYKAHKGPYINYIFNIFFEHDNLFFFT